MKALFGIMAIMLFSFLASPVAANEWVDAGPIWNDFDAQRKCPTTCGNTKWDGNWKTTVQGRVSVCSCSGKPSRSSQSGETKVKVQKIADQKKKKGGVDGGKIWTDMMAEQRCPSACKPRKWDGRWSYGDINHSTCYCQ